MRVLLTSLLMLLLLPLTARAATFADPPSAAPASIQADWRDLGEQPPPDRPPPPPPGELPPPPPNQRPPGERPLPPGPPDRPGAPGEGLRPPPPWGPLMRMLADRRPELAQRLERLRREDPQRFEQVLMDAFMLRLEETLSAAEADRPPAAGQPGQPFQPHRPAPGGPPTGPESGPPPGPFGPRAPMDEKMHALQQRQQQLEQRTHELAEKLRGLPEGAAERDSVRDELSKTTAEQFDLRTELRRAEVGRIEQELDRLRQTVQRMRQDIERRERERDSIIQRRIEQLLGQDAGGW